MTVKIAIVGKYIELSDAYKSINEALIHAGIHTKTKIEIVYLDAELIEKHGTDLLKNVAAIIVPGGFGARGIEGKIKAIQYAREQQIPFLGICLGMQTAIIEFARNVVGWKDANSTEFVKSTNYPVIALISEWLDADGSKQIRDESTALGGTMRLGAQVCQLVDQTLAYKIYNQKEIIERHRHRYEVNNNYLDELMQHGLVVCGTSADKTLVEMIELKDHPWFLGVQFHPEFTSNPRRSHPLFKSFVLSARAYKDKHEIM